MTQHDAWEIVIGLEVHAQLKTDSKIFSRESTAFGAEPNQHVNEVCAGLPGVLPVLNKRAVELAMRAGFALGCDVHRDSRFDRKNYFYPDLPKGYQISQLFHPICTGGAVTYVLDGEERTCRLTRIHMEEDAGKSTHRGDASLVDLNRAGIPLIEIVSEPELRSPAEAAAYLKALRNLLRALNVCDGNMEQGSFRCDANVSVRRPGEPLGTRAELKNINSFRFIQRAIEYEANRQIDLIESGGAVVQETRLYNSDTGRTASMRSKEEAHDYRYFPDPDLPPLRIDEAWYNATRDSLPELPHQRRQRYQRDLGLSLYDADNLTAAPPLSDYFEAVLALFSENPKNTANWILNTLLAHTPNPDAEPPPIPPQHLADLLRLIHAGDLNHQLARQVFDLMLTTHRDPTTIIDAEGLRPVRDTAGLEALIHTIIDENPAQVAQYREGKDKLFSFFMGQLMKKTQGKADANLARDTMTRLLKGE